MKFHDHIGRYNTKKLQSRENNRLPRVIWLWTTGNIKITRQIIQLYIHRLQEKEELTEIVGEQEEKFDVTKH